jgi:glycosyltransferase involved in cell wall biosynthesis
VNVAVLIPAHNEVTRIAATVTAARAIPGVTRVVVVDDGSTDDTAEVAEASGAKVVRLFGNRGKGTALEAGAARVADADVILLLDGDLGPSAEQGAALLAPVLSGDADMTIGRFPKPAHKAGFGFVMRLARWGIHALGSREFEASAPLSGQRALTRTCLATIRPFSAGYGAEVGLTIRALRAGFRVVEVQTTMEHSATGRDLAGFLHRGSQFAHVALALAALAFQPAPERKTGDEL